MQHKLSLCCSNRNSAKPTAVSRLAPNAFDLATRQTPFTLKLKALISQLERSAPGALADKELGEEMVRFLRSGAQDTTVAIANDWCHLCKARVYTIEDVVQLREERERIDREKATKIKMCQNKAAAKAALV
jgi:hypothetical protein